MHGNYHVRSIYKIIFGYWQYSRHRVTNTFDAEKYKEQWQYSSNKDTSGSKLAQEEIREQYIRGLKAGAVEMRAENSVSSAYQLDLQSSCGRVFMAADSLRNAWRRYQGAQYMVHQRSRISSGRKRRFNHARSPILNQRKLARYQIRSQLNWSQKSHRWFKEERCLTPSSTSRSEILFLMLPNKHSGDDTPWEKYIPMCVKASNIRISTPPSVMS